MKEVINNAMLNYYSLYDDNLFNNKNRIKYIVYSQNLKMPKEK